MANPIIDEVLNVAQSWVGQMFRPGIPAQCAYFVREVFKQAGVTLPVTDHPTDNLPTGEGYADSFAGDDVGVRIERADLTPGDLVLFENSYGNFPPGVITHVGIYVGNGEMIDRPTSSEPVQRRSIDLFIFSQGRRLDLPSHLFKAFAHDNKMQIVLDGQTLPARFIRVNGRLVDNVEIIVGY